MGLLDTIMSGVGKMAGDLPSMVASSALSFLGSSLASNRAEQNASEAFERSQASYGTRYQTTVKDMRAAGLNPILASSGGFSVGNAPQMAAAPAYQAHQPTIIPATQSGKNLADTAHSEAQAEESKKRAENIVQDTANKVTENLRIIEDTQLKRVQQGVAKAEEARIIEETKRVSTQMAKDLAEIAQAQEHVRLMKQQGAQSRAEVERIYATEKEIKQKTLELVEQTRSLSYKNDELQKTTNVYRGPLGDIIGGMKSAVQTLFPFIKK